MNSRAVVVVSGRVQGVGYRYFALHQARLYELVGTVRNQNDGSVCVTVEGKRETLEIYLQKLKEGPKFAQVVDIAVDWQHATGEFKDFAVRI
ncbi:MAG TPA: acylphosphatase [bacterium]|jgi:acylphosphatase|nr:acylphosphatase [bacterium]HNT66059.1 acylphosphatase [bacterium]HOX85508.1 acylphosphatase [bacterium]HPG44667.1 acylphosphatase [bacterium]HPM99426.1 acylphosphatase [bacterium]